MFSVAMQLTVRPEQPDAHYISELVVRGLAQSRDRIHRAALLQVLDLLLELGVDGINYA